MYCYFCGKENKDEQKFCKYCGKKLHLDTEDNSSLEKDTESKPAEEIVSEIRPEPKPVNELEPVNEAEAVIESVAVIEPENKTEEIPEINLESIPEIKPDPKWAADVKADPEWAETAETEKELPVKPDPVTGHIEKKKKEKPVKRNGVNILLIAVIVFLSLALLTLGLFLAAYFIKGTLNPIELFIDKNKEVNIEETESVTGADADAIGAEKNADTGTDMESNGAAEPDIVTDGKGKEEADDADAEDTPDDEPGHLEDSVWQEAYRKTLKDSVDGIIIRDQTVCAYYVYDIDKDDVPELIVQFGDSTAEAHGLIYTISKTNKEPMQIGDVGLGSASLYTYPKGNGIIRDYAHMDCQETAVLSIDNGTIKEETIHEQENDFNGKKEWYKDVDDIVAGSLYIEPTEPSDDSAISGYRDNVKEIISQKNKEIHRYEIFTEDITWTEAYDKCRQMGGYLARIDTDEENEHICDLLNSKGVTGVAYIGGRRDPDSLEYHWVGNDGELYDYDISFYEYYKFWLDDEPSYTDEVDGKTIDECYMSMLYKKDEGRWYWNDISNDVRSLAPKYYTGKISYICEYE